jgi:DNA-directed RNA polymerase subunit delta
VAEYNLKIDKDKIMEMPMVDLAFEVLKAKNQPLYYRDLMAEIAKIRGLSEAEVNEVIAQLYTEINIDGRFACVGGNVWGLKRWYPVEKADDQVVGGGRYPLVINDEDDIEDEDLYVEEEDAYLPEDEEAYGLFDEERDELFDEGEETADLDEDVVLDDEPPVLGDELEDESLAEEFEDAEEADFDEDEPEEDEDL